MVIDQIDISEYEKLPRAFYHRSNVVEIARDLIGKLLISHIDGDYTAGMIVEVEAYQGATDRASHAYGKRTSRTEVMYGSPGHAYVYLCYGIHQMFNIVTNENGNADAILVRAAEPVAGQEVMELRRGGAKGHRLTSGPGSLGKAFGFHTSQTGTDLLGDTIWIAAYRQDLKITADRRVGVDYAREDAKLPWRFFAEGNPYVSRGVQKPMK